MVDVSWLVNNFVDRVPGVSEAALVTAGDGQPIAASSGLDPDGLDRLAAVASGLVGLGYGAAGRFGGGAVRAVTVDMEQAQLLVAAAGGGCLLAVVAGGQADATLVAGEMALLGQLASRELDGQVGPVRRPWPAASSRRPIPAGSRRWHRPTGCCAG